MDPRADSAATRPAPHFDMGRGVRRDKGRAPANTAASFFLSQRRSLIDGGRPGRRFARPSRPPPRAVPAGVAECHRRRRLPCSDREARRPSASHAPGTAPAYGVPGPTHATACATLTALCGNRRGARRKHRSSAEDHGRKRCLTQRRKEHRQWNASKRAIFLPKSSSSSTVTCTAGSRAASSWTARASSRSAGSPRSRCSKACGRTTRSRSRSRRTTSASRPNTSRIRRRRDPARCAAISRGRQVLRASSRASSSSTRTAASIRTSRTSRAGWRSTASSHSRPTR